MHLAYGKYLKTLAILDRKGKIKLYDDKIWIKAAIWRNLAKGKYSKKFGEEKCMSMLGCKGPISHCLVPSRGFIDGVGGCPNIGGLCIGCTEPEFPDEPFGPFLKKAPPEVYIEETIGDIIGKISALIGRLKPRKI